MARKYKLGDKWSEDFDYDGMVEYGRTIDTKTSEKTIEKYADSLEDVNYHTLAKPLFDLEVAMSGDKEKIKRHFLVNFRRTLSKQLVEFGDKPLTTDEIYFFEKGGEVGKTYQIKGADVTFYEDSYEEGEQDQFHSYYLDENDFPYKTKFSNKKDLFETLNDFVSYADMKEEDFYVDEDTIQTSALVKHEKGSDWDEFSAPTEKEKELWKKGEMKLYSAQFVFPYEVYKKEKLEFAKGGKVYAIDIDLENGEQPRESKFQYTHNEFGLHQAKEHFNRLKKEGVYEYNDIKEPIENIQLLEVDNDNDDYRVIDSEFFAKGGSVVKQVRLDDGKLYNEIAYTKKDLKGNPTNETYVQYELVEKDFAKGGELKENNGDIIVPENQIKYLKFNPNFDAEIIEVDLRGKIVDAQIFFDAEGRDYILINDKINYVDDLKINSTYAKGGEMDNNTFVNLLKDNGFKEQRTKAKGVRLFYNDKNDMYASVDDKNRLVQVFEDNDIVGDDGTTPYSGYSVRELSEYLTKNKYMQGGETATVSIIYNDIPENHRIVGFSHTGEEVILDELLMTDRERAEYSAKEVYIKGMDRDEFWKKYNRVDFQTED